MKRPQTYKPRFRIDRRGNATIAGIPYDDMRSILTWAALQYYDDRKNFSRTDDLAWFDRLKWCLDELEKSMHVAFREGRPEPDPPPLKVRLRQKEKDRQWIKQVMKNIQARHTGKE